MIRRLAVIPARGGSKRIPNKNVKEFCGKPMIAHILGAAKESGLFDVIHVSTESDHVRDVVEALGFKIEFMRPSELADDHTPIMPVLKYVADTYVARGQSFDQVWMLMACAPLIETRDLQQAAALFDRTSGVDPLLAVAEYSVPIEWAFRRSGDGKLSPVHAGMFAVRSQDLERKYFDVGACAIFPTNTVRASQGAGSDSGFIGYVLPKWKAIDIDDQDDWDLAQALYRLRRA